MPFCHAVVDDVGEVGFWIQAVELGDLTREWPHCCARHKAATPLPAHPRHGRNVLFSRQRRGSRRPGFHPNQPSTVQNLRILHHASAWHTQTLLRDASESLPMRVIALKMLALRGNGIPDRRTRKMTFYRLSTTLSVAHGREMMVKEGAWNKFRWRLTECG